MWSELTKYLEKSSSHDRDSRFTVITELRWVPWTWLPRYTGDRRCEDSSFCPLSSHLSAKVEIILAKH